MAGLAKMYEKDVLQARLENDAAVVNEYQPAWSNIRHTQPAEKDPYLFSPEQVASLWAFIERASKECKERMSREKVVVYERTRSNENEINLTLIAYMTKTEADRLRTGLTGGELLDIDAVHIGIMLSGDYLLVSEAAFLRGLQRHGSNVDL